jgi:Zn-dependent oligopeptidase
MNLSVEDRKKLVLLQKEIGDLEQKGEANINEDKSKIELSVAELKGVPKEAIANFPKVAGKADYRIVELNKKQAGPAMKYLELDETRKKLNFAMENVGSRNVPLINELTKKRHIVAQMLNYSSFADLILEPRMAHSIKNVDKLLDGITHRITNMARKEHQKIVDFKRSFPG